jgi:hypothetical protein
MTVVALIFLWPRPMLVPGAGLDNSFAAALAMASQRGFHFGHQIVYTFGPLGFLHVPTLYYTRTALLSELFVVAVEAGLMFVVARNLVRAFGRLLGAVVFGIVAGLGIFPLVGSFPTEMGTLLVALLAIQWLQSRAGQGPDGRGDVVIPATLGAAAGLLLLVKFDAGTLALLLLGVVCLLRLLPAGAGATSGARDANDAGGAGDAGDARAVNDASAVSAEDVGGLRKRATAVAASAGAAIAGALVSVVVLWLAAGQRIGDLAAYVRGSLQLAQGFSSAMGIEIPRRRHEYIGASVMFLVFVGLATWAGIRGSKGWARMALPLVMVGAAESLFKEGFIRHDGHSVIFFAGLLILASLLWQWIPRPVGLVSVVVAIPLLLSVHPDWARLQIVRTGPQRAKVTLQYLFEPSKRARLRQTSRLALRTAYGLPPNVVAELAGHTVHIDPWEATVAWAYPEFKWDPPPVFQTYAAYTESLDGRNAAFLDSTAAPEFILRANTALDGRNSLWESPAYIVEMMCRYRQIDLAAGWQVLQRTASRCGTPTTVSTTTSPMGSPIVLAPPPDGTIETVRISWRQPISEALHTLLYKDLTYLVLFSGKEYRLVPGTALSPHVVSVPACLGWSPLLVPTFGPSMTVSQGPVFAPASPLRYLLGPVATSRRTTVTVETVPFRCPS